MPLRNNVRNAEKEPVMKNGKCPKCGSNEVYSTRAVGARSDRALSLLSSVSLAEYVCCGCGFVETYLNDLHDRDKVKERGAKVEMSEDE